MDLHNTLKGKKKPDGKLDFCELLVSPPHVLRHERAIRLLDAGFSESAVAEELGQSDTRQIRRDRKPSDALRHKRLNEVD
jgi:integrase